MTPCCSGRTEYDTDSGFKLCTALLITPEKPGSAHIFGKFVSQPPKQSRQPGLQQRLRKLPISLRLAALGAMMKLAGIPKQAAQHALGHDVPNQVHLLDSRHQPFYLCAHINVASVCTLRIRLCSVLLLENRSSIWKSLIGPM